LSCDVIPATCQFPSSTTMKPSSDSFTLFASPHFDPNDYANAVLAGEPYLPSSDQSTRPSVHDPPPKEDISVAISKLSNAIEDVSKQIKTLVRSMPSSRYLLSYLSLSRSQLTIKIYFPKPQVPTACLVHSHLFAEALMTSSRPLKSMFHFYEYLASSH
jgi:hypothetical protein